MVRLKRQTKSERKQIEVLLLSLLPYSRTLEGARPRNNPDGLLAVYLQADYYSFDESESAVLLKL